MQSYRTKFSELKLIIEEYDPICVCLQETLLGNFNAYPPSNHMIFQNTPHRPDDRHERGVAILVNKKYHATPLPIITDLQAVCIKLHLRKTYTICSLYLPHEIITKQEIESIITQLPQPFVILGDMNARSEMWGCSSTNQRGDIFEELITDLPISLLNDNSPTHYHIQTGTLSVIDLSIASSDCLEDFTYRVSESLHDSDHFPILISMRTPQCVPERPDRFDVSKADWGLFYELTEADINLEDDIDEIMENIGEIFYDAAMLSMPLKTGSYRRVPVPWFDEQCKEAKKARNRAERALKRNRTEINKIAYNRRKAQARYQFNKSRKQSYRDFISSINQRTSLHQIWKRVAKISKKFTSHPTPRISIGNDNYTNQPEEVAEILAQHFASVASDNNYSREFINYRNTQERKPINFSTNAHLIYNEPFSTKEFHHALMSTSESAPGQDLMTYSMIKNCHTTMHQAILNSFNKIFSEETFPEKWKTAIIIPIPKPNKDSTLPKNYRPIALINCLTKLFERMVNLRMMWFLETNNIICRQQSGFRRNRGTTDNIAQLEQDLNNAISHRSHTIAVFFDLAKAYDSAWRYGIVKRMYEAGLRGHLPVFVRNFLHDRKIRVRIGNTLSGEKTLPGGIMQGSVLSCTCFMIAINGITDTLPDHVKASLYVDDYLIYATGRLPHLVERRIQNALNALQKWSNQTGFTFSEDKCKTMHICRRRGCLKNNIDLTLYGNRMRSVEEKEFLGVIIDNSLTWKPHTKELKRKCGKVLDLLKHLSHKEWGADRASLLRLYIMLLKPRVDYGSESYNSSAKTTLAPIRTIQNAAIRIATGALRSSPISSLHAESGILPQEYYHDIKTLNFLIRIYVNPTHPMHDLIPADDDDDDDSDGEVVPRYPEKCFISRAGKLANKYSINMHHGLPELCPRCPPWSVNVKICRDLYDLKKHGQPPEQTKAIFIEHLNSNHSNSYCIYTDGSKTTQGVAFAYLGAASQSASRIHPFASVFTAELLAIHDAVVSVEDVAAENVTIITDSKSACLALTTINPKNTLISKIQDRICSSVKEIKLCWVPSHVRRH